MPVGVSSCSTSAQCFWRSSGVDCSDATAAFLRCVYAVHQFSVSIVDVQMISWICDSVTENRANLVTWDSVRDRKTLHDWSDVRSSCAVQPSCSGIVIYMYDIKFCVTRIPLIAVASRSQAWVCGPSLAGIVGSNPSRGMDVCLLWVLCVVR
jgi:hypothetical protein